MASKAAAAERGVVGRMHAQKYAEHSVSTGVAPCAAVGRRNRGSRSSSSHNALFRLHTGEAHFKNVLCPWTQIDSRSRPPFCRCHCVALRCACSAQHLLAARPAQGSTTSRLFTDRRRWCGVYDDVQLNPVSPKTSAQRPEAARCHRPRAPPPALFVAVQQVRGGGPRLRTQALSHQQTQLDSVSQPKSP
jgi:hypothetical protein